MFRITIKTLENLEETLAQEIEGIGGENILTGKRVVHFDGDKAMLYRANYRLRTALRVFKQISSFKFTNIDTFYVDCMKIKWESYLTLNQSFAIQSTVTNSLLFKNSMFASLKVKDALADRFRQRFGNRPDVDVKTPDIIFHVHINQNECTISVDSSGESLHKRGYRQVQGEAPLNEVLAAGMILLAGWKGETDFMDPMCGSGTLPIEAAMIARNIPPARLRKNFAFMAWKDYDEKLFEKIKEEVEIREFDRKIFSSDILKKNVLAAQTNARAARVYNLIEFQTCDFENLDISLNDACIMMNPPYGERLVGENLHNVYSMMGSKLKHAYLNNVAWILSSNEKLMYNIGLKPSAKIKLLNGALECGFHKYALFEGKRKTLVKNQNQDGEKKSESNSKKRKS